MKLERPVRLFIGSDAYRMTHAEADGLFVRANNFQRKAKGQEGDLVRVTMKQVFKSSDSVVRIEEYYMSKENEALLCEKAGEVQGKSKAKQNEKTRLEKSAKQHGKRIDKQERRMAKKTLKQLK
ncbi:MAG: hypothetical protein FWE97_03315 [Dehalococcoidia bacterium]|nr:hypothetical protein [Dehalococcoidia bacterium]